MIGERLFTDGATRAVYLGPDGRQYVRDAGRKVYGVWLPPDEGPDPAVIVEAPLKDGAT
jgi:hypothetical protein